LLSTNLDPVLMAQGGNKSYTSVKLNPLSSSSSTTSELVTLNATVSSGISLRFASNPVTLSSDSRAFSVPLTVAVGQNTAPGNYTVNVQASSGAILEKYTFTVRVVQYLVYMVSNTFQPDTISVKTGSTVFWMSLDAGFGGDPGVHNVVFTAGAKTSSGDLHQFDSYSFTFTSPGTYTYICSYHPPAMKGTVTVTA
jgi:plastocyanin